MASRETFTSEVEIVPDPLQPNFRLLFKRDNRQGVTALYQSSDGGVTYQILLPVPGPSDKVGSVPVLTSSGVEWQLPSVANKAFTTAASGGSDLLQFVDMYLGDVVFVGAIFGYFRVPNGYNYMCREIQLSIMAQADMDIVVETVDGNGSPLGHTAKLPASFRAKSNILTAPFLMSSTTVWGLKINSAGTVSAPGENLSVRLVLELQ